MKKEWKKFNETELGKIRSNPYVKSATENMIRFTVAFKEEFLRRYTEENQSPSKIMTDLGFDVNVLGETRIAGIVMHLRQRVNNGEEFSEIRKASESKILIDEPMPNSKAIIKMQHKLAYFEQEVEFIKKYNCGQQGEAEKMIHAESSVKFAIIQEMSQNPNNKLKIELLCDIAGVSRSGYYRFLSAKSVREEREENDKKDFELILRAYRHRGYDKGVRH
ncbi:MAG: hypothetical protein LBM93_04855 [Oscillospiraceae bacterium]|jgi:hypothetical protein|nr:hypothetical protein [Oscillospiraceae bacterium]